MWLGFLDNSLSWLTGFKAVYSSFTVNLYKQVNFYIHYTCILITYILHKYTASSLSLSLFFFFLFPKWLTEPSAVQLLSLFRLSMVYDIEDILKWKDEAMFVCGKIFEPNLLFWKLSTLTELESQTLCGLHLCKRKFFSFGSELEKGCCFHNEL